jgi:hypothetical protein
MRLICSLSSCESPPDVKSILHQKIAFDRGTTSSTPGVPPLPFFGPCISNAFRGPPQCQSGDRPIQRGRRVDAANLPGEETLLEDAGGGEEMLLTISDNRWRSGGVGVFWSVGPSDSFLCREGKYVVHAIVGW